MHKTWRPSPFLLGSSVVHLGALGLCAFHPDSWPLALGGVLINHGAITAAGLLPRCTLLGANLTRLPEALARQGALALTIDDGPDPEVTPRVLELLATHGACATFFCIGERVERHPELAQAIVAAGHAIENHGQRHHKLNSLLGVAGWQREISEAQDCITRITAQVPRFYRPTAGLRNPFLDPVLHRLGLHLASWTRRGFDTRNKNAETVLQRLSTKLSGGDILLLHDGNAARTQQGNPVIIEVLPALLARIKAAGLHTVTLRSVL